MENFDIKGDETTPTVKFDATTGLLKMSGVAIPEDVRTFFAPIRKWVNNYLDSPQAATELILHFDYLNTAASKMVFELCDIISGLHGREDCNVKITWKYFRGDNEMRELGEEVLEQFYCFKEILAVDEHPF
ncbi:MAG: DUF1987 domain-containing protein [Bacteroidales bacterium]|nr:DUF1987 domain-containing protein [Bacteroidales bacterium]